jgi:hypothetical protein
VRVDFVFARRSRTAEMRVVAVVNQDNA